MNFEAGIRFIVFLIIFGVTNYLMMLRRYENYIQKKKYLQREKISKLYQKVHLFSEIKKVFVEFPHHFLLVFCQP